MQIADGADLPDLRFAEEIVLLLLDDDTGKFIPVPPYAMDRALAGSVLMDLALENRIDSDAEMLNLINDTPVGDSLLAPLLSAIVRSDERYIRYWVEQSTQDADAVCQETLARLVDNGVLEKREGRIFSRSPRYLPVDGRSEHEIRQRLLTTLLSDTIPDPHDVATISLTAACDLFPAILTEYEWVSAQPRIELIRQMDFIGQAITQAIRDMQAWLTA